MGIGMRVDLERYNGTAQRLLAERFGKFTARHQPAAERVLWHIRGLPEPELRQWPERWSCVLAGLAAREAG